jgi:hypothetical protein
MPVSKHVSIVMLSRIKKVVQWKGKRYTCGELWIYKHTIFKIVLCYGIVHSD